jgi:hypothetical protein
VASKYKRKATKHINVDLNTRMGSYDSRAQNSNFCKYKAIYHTVRKKKPFVKKVNVDLENIQTFETLDDNKSVPRHCKRNTEVKLNYTDMSPIHMKQSTEVLNTLDVSSTSNTEFDVLNSISDDFTCNY